MAAGSASGGGSQGIKAGRAYVEVTTDQAGLRAGLQAAKRAVLSFGKQLTAAGAVGLGLGAAIVGPIAASFKEMVQHYGKFQDLADRTGATAEDLSALGYAAEQSDASLEDVANGAKFLQKNLLAAGEGSDQAVEALGRLGLKAEDLKGKAFGDQLELIADGMKNLPDEQKRPALEAIMGKGAGALLPMLKDGAAGLRALKKEAEETGSIISGKDAKDAEAIGDAISKSWTAVKNTFLSVGAALLPQVDTIQTFANGFVGAVRDVKRFIDENRQVILVVLGVGAGIMAAGAALLGLGLAITVATTAIGGLMAAGSALVGVLGVLFSPAGLVVAAAVVAAVVAVAAALELFPELFAEVAGVGEAVFGGLADTFGVAWQGIQDAMKSGDLKGALTIAVDALDVVWKGLILGLTLAWNDFKNTFVDGWKDAVAEIQAAMADLLQSPQMKSIVDRLPGLVPKLLATGAEVAITGGQTAEQIRAARAKAKADDQAARSASAVAAALDLLKSKEKLKEDAAAANKGAFVADMWRAWDFLVGTMPDEAKRKAAVEGLGNVRGQFGGYGAGSSLGVSGDSIQKQQLAQLEDINENTKEGRGLVGV